MLMRIGERLGFEKRFCEDTVKEILDNKHIVDVPPQFSDPCITKCFIRDGLRLSLADGQVQDVELSWLKAVAEANGLDETWYDGAVRAASDRALGSFEDSLDAECLEWW
jgi:hypothetical protein